MTDPVPARRVIASPVGVCLLRELTLDDAESMLDYINTLSRERTFTNMQGEQLTIDNEIAWISNQIRDIAAGNTVQLIVSLDGGLIGVAGIRRQTHVSRHVGVLGISIAKPYRGLGIGRGLMEAIIAEACVRLDGLTIINLDLFATNASAYHLYKSLGFIECGRLPGGIIHQGQPVDRVMMYLPLAGHASKLPGEG